MTRISQKIIQTTQETSGSEFHLVAELKDCPNPKGFTELSFSTVWTGAKNPKEAHDKFTVILSPEAIAHLTMMLHEFKHFTE